jgi:hypothetical protein
MYEMKGALCGTPPRLDWLAAKQFQFRWFPSVTVPARLLQPHRSGSSGFPASPFQLGWFPSLAGPTRPASQLHRFQFGRLPSFTVSSSAGLPASPFPVRLVLPPRRSGPSGCPSAPAPRAAPPVPNTPRQIPVSRPFPRPGEAPGWCPFLAVNAFLRPPRPSRKSRREFIWTFFRIHMLSTESRRLSAYFSGYPLASAQLIHKSPDVTPRRGAKPICVPQHEGGSHAIVTLPRPAVPGPKRVDGTSVRF